MCLDTSERQKCRQAPVPLDDDLTVDDHQTVPPTRQAYPLSLHDALPIYDLADHQLLEPELELAGLDLHHVEQVVDRKSTRLNSSHLGSSYAVFGLKRKRPAYDGSLNRSQLGSGKVWSNDLKT